MYTLQKKSHQTKTMQFIDGSINFHCLFEFECLIKYVKILKKKTLIVKIV